MKNLFILTISILLITSCAKSDNDDDDSYSSSTSGNNSDSSNISDNATTFTVTVSYGKYYLDGVSTKSIKLKKENTWVVNGIKKTESLSLGLANVTAEALNTNNLVTNLKGNFFYSLDQRFPIKIDHPKNKFIKRIYK